MGRKSDSVETVFAVDDQGPLAAKPQQRLAHQAKEAGVCDAEHLVTRARGVGKRAEDVEDGADADLATGGANMTHGGVVRRGEHEAEADALDAGCNLFRSKLEADAERFQHVRAAAAAGGGPLPCLATG